MSQTAGCEEGGCSSNIQQLCPSQQEISDSPEPSCVSMKSDGSITMINFKDYHRSQVQQKSSDSPEPSCVSMKSDGSMDKCINFKDFHSVLQEGEETKKRRMRKQKECKISQVQQKSSDSPEPSCVSMKSDGSMDKCINFKDFHSVLQEGEETKKRRMRKQKECKISQVQQKSSDSPEPSCVSMTMGEHGESGINRDTPQIGEREPGHDRPEQEARSFYYK
ncbi:uncharacterized protein LOC127437460 isoform X3 [Myxocyprinus asiaticus]|uniref:uncharacterized protein LOC127437460 isoform X2 n=1 Tax=Myxocyprinus asiaticus TaxID=70543 RepID=UPI002223EB35|nr:uncharacterized protein LOC127437460 isoform X2 [Myxocyprinus asiaticus]XP_051548357.1 uncharacterized protein LOC127437460 isoform X3 [Myxocyprinus asiaticus]